MFTIRTLPSRRSARQALLGLAMLVVVAGGCGVATPTVATPSPTSAVAAPATVRTTPPVATATPEPVSSSAPTAMPIPAGAAPPWQPAPGTSWQWQLVGDINTSHDVAMYDIDLFDVSSELIADLQRDGRQVICYFSGGIDGGLAA